MTKLTTFIVQALAIVVVLLPVDASATGNKKTLPPANVVSAGKVPARNVPAATTGTAAERYCVNIADSAADARLLWHANTIKNLEARLQEKISALESKIAEHKTWLAKRSEFAKKANQSLLDIYAKMRPDAAAIQLAILDNLTAASILMKLKPRNASSILNEMKPAKAAQLSSAIAGAAKVPGNS